MMEDCVNKILDDANKKYLYELNEIVVNEEGGYTKDIENEGTIHRDMTENETETNQYTFEKVNKRTPRLYRQ